MGDVNQDRVKALLARLQQSEAPPAPAQPNAPAVDQGRVDKLLQLARSRSTGGAPEAPQQPTQRNAEAERQRANKLFALQDLIDLHGFEGVTPEELLQQPALLARYRKIAELESEALLSDRATELSERGAVDRVMINTGKALDDTAAGFVQLGLMAADAFGAEGANQRLKDFTQRKIREDDEFIRRANPQALDASAQFLSTALGSYGAGGAAATTATKAISRLGGSELLDAASKTATRRLTRAMLTGMAGGATQFAEDGSERAFNMMLGAALPAGIGGVAETSRLSSNALRRRIRLATDEKALAENLSNADASFKKYDMDGTLGTKTKSRGLQELERIASQASSSADFVAVRTAQLTGRAMEALRRTSAKFQGQSLDEAEVGRRIFGAARRARKQLTDVRQQAWNKYFTQAEEAGKRTVTDGRGRRRIIDAKVMKGPRVVSEINDVLEREALQDRLTGGAKNYLRKLQGRAAEGYSVKELQNDMVDLQNFSAGKGKISQAMEINESQDLSRTILRALRSEIDDAAEDGGAVSQIKKARGIYAMVSESVDAIDNQPVGALLKRSGVSDRLTDIQARGGLQASAVAPEQFSRAVRDMNPTQIRQFIEQTNASDPSLMNTVRASFIEDAIESSRVGARTSEAGGQIDAAEVVTKLRSPQAGRRYGLCTAAAGAPCGRARYWRTA